jgi:hypothetical protein
MATQDADCQWLSTAPILTEQLGKCLSSGLQQWMPNACHSLALSQAAHAALMSCTCTRFNTCTSTVPQVALLQPTQLHSASQGPPAQLTLGIQGMDLSTISTTWSGSIGA